MKRTGIIRFRLINRRIVVDNFIRKPLQFHKSRCSDEVQSFTRVFYNELSLR